MLLARLAREACLNVRTVNMESDQPVARMAAVLATEVRGAGQGALCGNQSRQMFNLAKAVVGVEAGWDPAACFATDHRAPKAPPR